MILRSAAHVSLNTRKSLAAYYAQDAISLNSLNWEPVASRGPSTVAPIKNNAVIEVSKMTETIQFVSPSAFVSDEYSGDTCP